MQLITEEAIRLWIEEKKPGQTVKTYTVSSTLILLSSYFFFLFFLFLILLYLSPPPSLSPYIQPTQSDAFVIFQHLREMGATRVMNSARKHAAKKKEEQRQVEIQKKVTKQPTSSSSGAPAMERSISGGRGGSSQAASQLNALRRRLSQSTEKHDTSTRAHTKSIQEGSVGVSEHMKRFFDVEKATPDITKPSFEEKHFKYQPKHTSSSVAAAQTQLLSKTPIKLRRQVPVGMSPFTTTLPKISLESFHKQVRLFRSLTISLLLSLLLSVRCTLFLSSLFSFSLLPSLSLILCLLSYFSPTLLTQVLGWSIPFLLSNEDSVSASASVLPTSFPNVEWYIHAFGTLLVEELRCSVSEAVKRASRDNYYSEAIEATATDMARISASEFHMMKLTTSIAVSDISNNNQNNRYGSRVYGNRGGGSNKRQVGDMLRPSDLILLVKIDRHDNQFQSSSSSSSSSSNDSSSFGFLGLVIEDEVSESVLQSQQANLVKGATVKRDVKVKVFASQEHSSQVRALFQEVIS